MSWRWTKNFARSFRVISLLCLSRCGRLAGRRVYALSIYGTEYIQNCPFGTGNGYGDGRAISVFEGIINGQRWEMQLKRGVARRPIAGVLTVAQYSGPVCVSF